MKIKTTNTILYCHKWEQVLAFYKTKLGLEINFSNEWFVEFKLTEQSYLSVADESVTSIKSSQGHGITITLEVEDIEDFFVFLKKSGCNPSPIKAHAWGATVIYVFDPEGNRLEFWRNL